MIKKLVDKYKKYFKANKNEQVCRCFNVTSDDIEKIINEGSSSIKDIRTITKAGKGCGRCNASVERVTYKAIKMKNKRLD
ncbi:MULTISPECIES: (2Fe-2S)-binding protein [Clostridia]|uniref:(2Fe-2S)-binding protein n=1 Tax=Clostridium sp. CCUG 7971 TaxID=2811414 RepID=UPI001ABA48F5|nr:(2Fe-2S)-binding protein [Clostridium sp. CCUG 7971]MBO3442961.1 (2Fe-2S)-binding protein [Clostridium sp. CCUG 7971]